MKKGPRTLAIIAGVSSQHNLLQEGMRVVAKCKSVPVSEILMNKKYSSACKTAHTATHSQVRMTQKSVT